MKFLVKEKDDNKRLDVFLSEKIEHLTRSNIKKIIEACNVKIDKKIVNSPSKKVKTNDSVIVELLIKNSDKLLLGIMAALTIYFGLLPNSLVNITRWMVEGYL